MYPVCPVAVRKGDFRGSILEAPHTHTHHHHICRYSDRSVSAVVLKFPYRHPHRAVLGLYSVSPIFPHTSRSLSGRVGLDAHVFFLGLLVCVSCFCLWHMSLFRFFSVLGIRTHGSTRWFFSASRRRRFCWLHGGLLLSFWLFCSVRCSFRFSPSLICSRRFF